MAVNHGYGKIAGTDALVFAYDTGDTRNSYKGPPTQNFAHVNVANCSSTSGWDGTAVHTQFGLTRSLGVLKDGRTTFHVTYTPNVDAGDCYHTFRLKDINGTNVQTNGGEVFYLTFEWKSEGAEYLVSGNDNWDLSTFYGNGWKTGTPMITENLGDVPIGNGWYKKTMKYTAAAVAGQTPLMRFSSGYKRTQGGNYQLWVANIAMTSNYPAGNWLPGQSIRSATEGLLDLTGNQTVNLTNVSFDSNAQIGFDGTNDYINLGSDITIKSSGGWSVESVVYYDSVAGGYNNVTSPANFIGSESITYNSWYWSVLNSKLALWNRSPGLWKYGSTTIQPDTWYHVVLVSYDSGTSYQMYLNGVAEGGDHTTYSWNASYSGLKVRYIGRGNQSNTRLVSGNIPVTKIYNRALTAAEVQTNFNHYKTRFNIT
jgi:hypothetical protein